VEALSTCCRPPWWGAGALEVTELAAEGGRAPAPTGTAMGGVLGMGWWWWGGGRGLVRVARCPPPAAGASGAGANLFFTEDARLVIEARGIPLFKDSSANKGAHTATRGRWRGGGGGGRRSALPTPPSPLLLLSGAGGVTSSSLEVMAALALTDAEFAAHMCLPADAHAATPADAHAAAPAFYKEYVAEVQSECPPPTTPVAAAAPLRAPSLSPTHLHTPKRSLMRAAAIEVNAKLEFECLWAEHTRTRTPISTLSDQLSTKITDLSTRIEQSDSLWGNATLRARILREAIPASLARLVGGADVAIARLPVNYLRALFGSRLASRFIYACGLGNSDFAFYEYVDRTMKAEGGAGAAGGV
jgi:glutamate dehydrogenase